MRVLGLVLAGTLVLVAPVAALAAPLGSPVGRGGPGPAPSLVQIGDGNGQTWHPPSNGSGRNWRQAPGQPQQWNGGPVPPRWGANGPPAGWGRYPGPGVPTYWVWGPSGGAFDYPFADWRGPTGGWGNP